jgi:peptidoglycan/xylan/chitin deacetylase (PgdA/CDA1 family)
MDAPSLKGHCATSNCVILQYHRVALLSHDPLRLAVQPCNFERQMEYLAANFHVISLHELRQHLETATPWRARTVAVTFDGGYSDVLYTAQDVLERYAVPATVFVPSGPLVERTRFWWDVLEDILIAGDPHGPLVVETEEESYRWSLTSQHDRFRAFDDLYGILSDQAPDRQQDILSQIQEWLEDPGPERDSHATLSAPELRQLEAGGLITVGGHTHHGVKLSRLSEREQRSEIQYNKQALEEVLGHAVEYFAYPFGDEGSYTGATQRILRDCGFRLSCRVSCDTVSVTGADSPYELPRLAIRDWNLFTFHRYLSAFLG